MTKGEFERALAHDPLTGSFTWRVSHGRAARGSIAGGIDKDGYRVITLKGVDYRAHRLAWFLETGAWPVGDIDHINGDRLDNRIENLRLATRSENNQNIAGAPNHSTTKLLGAQLDRKRGGYQATISMMNKTINLGRYATPELAHSAYMAAKTQLHTNNDRLLGAR